MATRTDSSATWVQFGAGLLVGGALVLGTACAAIHVTDGWENVRGRSRGQASNGRSSSSPSRSGRDAHLRSDSDMPRAEHYASHAPIGQATAFADAAPVSSRRPQSVKLKSNDSPQRVPASRPLSAEVITSPGRSRQGRSTDVHRHAGGSAGAFASSQTLPSASTQLPGGLAHSATSHGSHSHTVTMHGRSGSPKRTPTSPVRGAGGHSMQHSSGAFHVTTLQREQQQQPPPIHMMLQNPTQAQSSGAPASRAAGFLSLATIPWTADPKERGRDIEQAAANDEYCRVITAEAAMTEEDEAVCHNLVQALDLRWKWLFRPHLTPTDLADVPEAACPSKLRDHFEYTQLPPSHLTFALINSVYRVFNDAECTSEAFPVPGTDKEYFTDMLHMLRVGAAGPVKTYCHHRLVLLEQKFNLHVMVNADKEYLAQKTAPHRDFYNVRKVDTHVHHSACMHQKHLLRFIKSKLRKESDEIVIFRDGKFLTLREVFESLNLTAYDLNVDTLDMHADKTIFHRFDKFNLKYNPFGQSRLREIFVKQDNLLHGRFLAELTQEVFSDLEDTKYQHTEYRISIYGRKTKEWDILAAWVCQNKLYSDNNVWLIQIPRLYNIYKAQGLLDNFEQMIINIFEPLFEVTMDPESHPQLSIFLQQVVGFDMVDDESKPERRPTKNMPKPVQWDNKYNPAYSYYCYYTYANLFTLNKLRESRGLNTFSFRPHSGEAGEIDHLASTFMLCDNIAHGINLRKSPFLQYLYYLAQVGLCMSPLSNNSLFLDYHKNPFPLFFARGLSVSLSTDDPLQIHLTKEPLVEEFSVAANMWKLSSTDTCEVARNGVLHSGFPHACKKHWISSSYFVPGPEGNDIQKTNVPNLRMRFRFDTHQQEMRLLYLGAMEHARNGPSSLKLD